MSLGLRNATQDGSAGRRQSHSQKAYDQLRELLRTRQYLPGDIVSEQGLAREFGMSRTPVREAVRRLAQEGLLRVIPNRGVLVASLSVEDVEEIYAIREVLEGLASRLAAARISKAGITRLEEILNAAQQGAIAGDVDVLTELDHDFHAEIARQSRNERLQAALTNMRDADVLQQYGRRDALHRGRYESSLSEHREVFEAITRHDSGAAEAAMRDHCRSTARFIADYVFGALPRSMHDAGSTEGNQEAHGPPGR
jgi:DNA-binding GntR family transcriptional regulator